MMKRYFYVLILMFVNACALWSHTLTPIVQAKVFLLESQAYSDKRVKVGGKIVARGPSDSFFLLEDSSGKILVGTERLSFIPNCPANQEIQLVGIWTHLPSMNESETGYLSLEQLVQCGTTREEQKSL